VTGALSALLPAAQGGGRLLDPPLVLGSARLVVHLLGDAEGSCGPQDLHAFDVPRPATDTRIDPQPDTDTGLTSRCTSGSAEAQSGDGTGRGPKHELDHRLTCMPRTMRISRTPRSTWTVPSATKPYLR
jgi:hypothetical protein